MKLTAIAAVVAIAIGGLIFFGVLSKEQVEGEALKAIGDAKSLVTNATTGFDDKEPTAADIKNADTCRSNLKRIESAKRAVEAARGTVGGTVSWTQILSQLGARSRPKCPMSGQYELGRSGQVPTCSILSNHTRSKKDDHVIANF